MPSQPHIPAVYQKLHPVHTHIGCTRILLCRKLMRLSYYDIFPLLYAASHSLVLISLVNFIYCI